MKLKTDFAFFFKERVDEIDDAEAVEEGRDVIAASDDGDFVPVVVALVANRFDKFVVSSEPAAAGDTLAFVVNAGGVPNSGFFTVAGDLVLTSAKEPRGLDFMSAEIERGVDAALEDVFDFRGEIVVRIVRDDQTVARFLVVMLADQHAVVGEGPNFGNVFRPLVSAVDIPAFVGLDEEVFPFADAKVLNADVFPQDFALSSGVNLKPEETAEIFVIEHVDNRNAVEPATGRPTTLL